MTNPARQVDLYKELQVQNIEENHARLPNKSMDYSIAAYPPCCCQQTVDELRVNLWSANCELEELRNNVGEEMRKKDEEINHLIQLLNAVNQERDEIREQLQMLLKYHRQIETPQFIQANCSSSFSDSESPSGIQNHHPYALSPAINSIGVDDSVIGIEYPNLYLDECYDVMESRKPEMNIFVPNISCYRYESVESKLDLLMKKPLPEKGKFLEAVMAAGPILNTLMVIGDLPRWRNPPCLKTLAGSTKAAMR